MKPLFVALALLAFGSANVSAQEAVSVSGSPGMMTISTATAGGQPLAATNSVTTYSIGADGSGTGHRLTGHLSANMPAGVTLRISLAAPTGATSSGFVTLDTVARDLVTNITNTTTETHAITYQLTATVAAGVISSSMRTVTFTLVAHP
jgi:hypothetical protein